jgi:hypothetical protein
VFKARVPVGFSWAAVLATLLTLRLGPYRYRVG